MYSIKLRGKHHLKTVVLDPEDYNRLKKYKWYGRPDHNGKIYVMRTFNNLGKTKCVALHRMITNALPGQIVDHIDGDTLNNRRSNLRLCNIANNNHNRKLNKNNTSGYKGVVKLSGKWSARIKLEGRYIYLGTYLDIKMAAKAYDSAAKYYFVEFANPNFKKTV